MWCDYLTNVIEFKSSFAWTTNICHFLGTTFVFVFKGDRGLYRNVWSVFLVSCLSQLLSSYSECTFGVLVSSCRVFFCWCFRLVKSLHLSKSLGLLNTGVWVFGNMLFWCEIVCVYLYTQVMFVLLESVGTCRHSQDRVLTNHYNILYSFITAFFSLELHQSWFRQRSRISEKKNSVNRFIVKNWFTWLCGWQGECEAKRQPNREDRLTLWAWAKTAINRWNFISQGGRTPAFKTFQGVNWAYYPSDNLG